MRWHTERVQPRSFPACLGLIAGAAFAARGLYALSLAPTAIVDRGDPRYFHLIAAVIAAGHGYISPLPWLRTHAALPSTEHPPLWPALLALVAKAGGGGWAAQRLVGSAVGAGTVAVTGLIGRRVAGERAGLLAAALAAAYPTFVAVDGSLMSEPLFALSVALALLAALRTRERPTSGEAVALGLAVGAATLVRGEGVLLLGLVIVARRPRAIVAALVAAVVVIAPWSVRNSLVLHRPAFVSSETASVLAGANCTATYAGPDIGYWRSDCATAGSGHAAAHASRLPLVVGVRLMRTFGLWQARRMVFFAEGRSLPGRSAAVVTYLLLAMVALASVRRLRPPWPVLGILAAPALLAALVSAVAFGDPRFRYAADVPMLVCAAAGLASVRPRVAQAARRRSAGSVV